MKRNELDTNIKKGTKCNKYYLVARCLPFSFCLFEIFSREHFLKKNKIIPIQIKIFKYDKQKREKDVTCARLSIKSFDGSYACSLLGISRMAGVSFVQLSIIWRTFSAICWTISNIAMSSLFKKPLTASSSSANEVSLFFL